MRFVIAFVALVAAAVMVGLGIAQRTLWEPPHSITANAAIPAGTQFVMIDGHTLNAQLGQQTIKVDGSSSPFIAYGRASDVTAWLQGTAYVRLDYLAGSTKLEVKKVAAKGQVPEGSANPVGSDLWLQSYSGSAAAKAQMNVPEGIDVLIASSTSTASSVGAAPQKITLTWPRDTATPWSVPLIIGGGVFAIVGIVFYVLGLVALRRRGSPRRGQRPPRGPGLIEQLDHPERHAGNIPEDSGSINHRGRRFSIIPMALAGAVLLAGCASASSPQAGAAATADHATDGSGNQGSQGSSGTTPPPVVSASQLNTIVNRISAVATKADKNLDGNLIATRFTGLALQARQVYYQAHSKMPSYQESIPSIPTTIKVGLPEATNDWPRYISAFVVDTSQPKIAPTDIVLVQQTPRENYMVSYAITLEPNANANLPPASVGAVVIPPASKLLAVAPDQVSGYYASYFNDGSSSSYFDTQADLLAPQNGASSKQQQIAKTQANGSTNTLTFTDTPANFDPVSFATTDSGAIVATAIDETQSSPPTKPGVIVSARNTNGSGPSATEALTGKTQSSTGFQVSYSYQLLFYVPPAGSQDKIRMLGYAQAVTGAKEL